MMSAQNTTTGLKRFSSICHTHIAGRPAERLPRPRFRGKLLHLRLLILQLVSQANNRVRVKENFLDLLWSQIPTMLTDRGEYFVKHPALKLLSIRQFRVSDKPVEVALSDEACLLYSACCLKGAVNRRPLAMLPVSLEGTVTGKS